MADFVDTFGVGSFPHAVDADGEIWSGFGVFTQPSWAFVSADGSVEVLLGALGEAGLRDRIDDLLAG